MMTEKDCLRYCKDLGFDWGGLYDELKRVSCFCCPLGDLDGINYIYKERNLLWQKIKRMDRLSRTSFRRDYSIAELEEKFSKE